MPSWATFKPNMVEHIRRRRQSSEKVTMDRAIDQTGEGRRSTKAPNENIHQTRENRRRGTTKLPRACCWVVHRIQFTCSLLCSTSQLNNQQATQEQYQLNKNQDNNSSEAGGALAKAGDHGTHRRSTKRTTGSEKGVDLRPCHPVGPLLSSNPITFV